MEKNMCVCGRKVIVHFYSCQIWGTSTVSYYPITNTPPCRIFLYQFLLLPWNKKCSCFWQRSNFRGGWNLLTFKWLFSSNYDMINISNGWMPLVCPIKKDSKLRNKQPPTPKFPDPMPSFNYHHIPLLLILAKLIERFSVTLSTFLHLALHLRFSLSSFRVSPPWHTFRLGNFCHGACTVYCRILWESLASTS